MPGEWYSAYLNRIIALHSFSDFKDNAKSIKVQVKNWYQKGNHSQVSSQKEASSSSLWPLLGFIEAYCVSHNDPKYRGLVDGLDNPEGQWRTSTGGQPTGNRGTGGTQHHWAEETVMPPRSFLHARKSVECAPTPRFEHAHSHGRHKWRKGAGHAGLVSGLCRPGWTGLLCCHNRQLRRRRASVSHTALLQMRMGAADDHHTLQSARADVPRCSDQLRQVNNAGEDSARCLQRFGHVANQHHPQHPLPRNPRRSSREEVVEEETTRERGRCAVSGCVLLASVFHFGQPQIAELQMRWMAGRAPLDA